MTDYGRSLTSPVKPAMVKPSVVKAFSPTLCSSHPRRRGLNPAVYLMSVAFGADGKAALWPGCGLTPNPKCLNARGDRHRFPGGGRANPDLWRWVACTCYGGVFEGVNRPFR